MSDNEEKPKEPKAKEPKDPKEEHSKHKCFIKPCCVRFEVVVIKETLDEEGEGGDEMSVVK